MKKKGLVWGVLGALSTIAIISTNLEKITKNLTSLFHDPKPLSVVQPGTSGQGDYIVHGSNNNYQGGNNNNYQSNTQPDNKQ